MCPGRCQGDCHLPPRGRPRFSGLLSLPSGFAVVEWDRDFLGFVLFVFEREPQWEIPPGSSTCQLVLGLSSFKNLFLEFAASLWLWAA